MSALDNNSLAGKLSKLLHMFASDRDSEKLAAVEGIVRVLKGAGLDVHDLADEIDPEERKKNGKKFTVKELEIYNRGIEDGRRQAEENQRGFRSVDALDEPSWHEIACECANHENRLNEKERPFVKDMVRWTVRGGEPTEKQAKWLRSIYARIRK
jgi:hypothetical protein